MAIKPFLESIDLRQNELLNVVIQNLSRPTINPKAGQIFYGTANEYDKKLLLWAGEWIDLTRRVHDGDKGDVLVSNDVQLWEVNPNKITYEKIQKAAGNNVLLGNIAGADTNFKELTGKQVTAILDVFTPLLPGLVPESGGSATSIIAGDSLWKEVAEILPANVAYTDTENIFTVDQTIETDLTVLGNIDIAVEPTLESHATNKLYVDNELLLKEDITKANFLFTQGVASTVWTIPHNLGKFPAVTVIDNSGAEYEGDVSHIDNNNLTITFSSIASGKATLN